MEQWNGADFSPPLIFFSVFVMSHFVLFSFIHVSSKRETSQPEQDTHHHGLSPTIQRASTKISPSDLDLGLVSMRVRVLLRSG